MCACQVRAQVDAMFEDCLSDMMEELWTALQVVGSAHSKVDVMASAMAQREAEVEALALARCAHACTRALSARAPLLPLCMCPRACACVCVRTVNLCII